MILKIQVGRNEWLFIEGIKKMQVCKEAKFLGSQCEPGGPPGAYFSCPDANPEAPQRRFSADEAYLDSGSPRMMDQDYAAIFYDGNIIVVDKAFILNDQGDTIERI